ncbi:MAG TPA: glycosyltransferase family 4 protein [bacterium]
MKVLHVINTAETGGGGEHLFHLVSGLRRHAITSSAIVGIAGPLVSRLRESGTPVEVLGPMGLAAIGLLARQFRAQRPDLIHLHGSRSGLLGSIAARRARARPVVYTAHALAFYRRLPGMLRWLAARAEGFTARTADRTIYLSDADRDSAGGRGVATSRAVVIPNGVDPRPFVDAPDRRAEFGFAASAPVAGMIARFVPQKDPLAFVRMAKAVTDRLPGARFLLVGDGPLRPAVAAAVRELGLDDAIRMTGWRSDIPALLATMDVFVLTSRWEGMPIVVLEAMASGKPVVAHVLPGLLEVLPPEQADLLIDPHDPGRYADAVIGLLADPARRREIGRVARSRVERYFTIDRMVDATVDVYRDAVSAGPG